MIKLELKKALLKEACLTREKKRLLLVKQETRFCKLREEGKARQERSSWLNSHEWRRGKGTEYNEGGRVKKSSWVCYMYLLSQSVYQSYPTFLVWIKFSSFEVKGEVNLFYVHKLQEPTQLHTSCSFPSPDRHVKFFLACSMYNFYTGCHSVWWRDLGHSQVTTWKKINKCPGKEDMNTVTDHLLSFQVRVQVRRIWTRIDIFSNRDCASVATYMCSNIRACESRKFCVEFIVFRARVNAHHRNWGTTELVRRERCWCRKRGRKQNEIWICETLNQMFWKHEEPTSLNLPKARQVQSKSDKGTSTILRPNPLASLQNTMLWRLDLQSYIQASSNMICLLRKEMWVIYRYNFTKCKINNHHHYKYF